MSKRVDAFCFQRNVRYCAHGRAINSMRTECRAHTRCDLGRQKGGCKFGHFGAKRASRAHCLLPRKARHGLRALFRMDEEAYCSGTHRYSCAHFGSLSDEAYPTWYL